ncbi:MAG: hypothetical protein LBV08_09065, partial [Clostridiales bacterium]|nr:hypothetical protein [Clostridiales bacterium]
IDTDIYLKAHKLYLDKNENGEALRVLLDNYGLLGGTSEFQTVLGNFYLEIEKDNFKALETLHKAFGCKGEGSVKRDEVYYYFQPSFLTAKIYLSMNEYNKALEFFKQAYLYNNKPEIYEMVQKLELIVKKVSDVQLSNDGK